MKKNQLVPVLAAVAALGVVGGIVTAQALNQPRESRSSVELVRPASDVSTPSTTTTTTTTTPVATATATQEEPVTPEPTSTTTAPEPTATSTPKVTPKPAWTPGNGEDVPIGDPRRDVPPPPVLGSNSTGDENGIVLPLPGQPADPHPSDTATGTTSDQP